MIKSLREIAQRHLTPLQLWSKNDDPRLSLSHPNTRLPTKYNGGANLLKGLKYSNDLLRNLGVDNLLVT